MAEKPLTLSIGQASSRGRKDINQDFHGAVVPAEPKLSSKGAVLAIADGISSSQVSQVASETAVKVFLDDYYCTSEAWSVKKSALRVLAATNSWLYAQTRNGPHRYDREKGYICTFSAIIIKSNTAHIFHSGDSRIYLLADKSLEQLTTDHCGFGEAQASYLTRALGMHSSLDMEYSSIPLSEGDCFILATDGVYDYLDQKTIVSAVSSPSSNFDVVAKQLVEQAYEAGSKDNLTLQLLRVDRLPKRGLEELQGDIAQLPFAPPLAARARIDGYEIIRDIYISSRSHVFLALDTDTRQQVVIKVPSVEMRGNAGYIETFLMEDWIAQRINNAHVLKAIEPSRRRSYLYSVTEYIEGHTLAQWMNDNPSPDVETVRNIIEQIAKGLQAFHRQEMVHQDLRPNNVMIDSNGTVKIIDFGATKVAGVSEIKPTNEGIVGTLQFTAPEYFLGELGTSRSDIFSLGVIAYQMLSGNLPYGTAISKARSPRAQGRLSYMSLREDKRSVPGWVDYAIQKATHINPLKRYAEVSEFVYDLKKPNARYQSSARPPLIERNPVLLWQGISAILLGLLILQNVN